jgi:RNA polymerase sigma factor FliA
MYQNPAWEQACTLNTASTSSTLSTASTSRGGAKTELQQMMSNLSLVKRVVKHLRSQVGTVVDEEDLLQIGLMGLLEAIRRYGDCGDGYFEGYAFKRVRGAILDELRRQDWRPRQVRQQANQLNQTVRDLTRKLGREPSERELSSEMGVSTEKVYELEVASLVDQFASLEDLLARGDYQEAVSSEIEQFQRKRTLRQALSRLNKREQILLMLYYQKELNMKEIALALDLTESRVCQLHKSAISELRKNLEWLE